MKIRYLVYILFTSLAFSSCQKNTVSKIPQISLMYFGTSTSTDSFIVNVDTPFMEFSIVDGDADLGNAQPGPPYDIYINDMRFDTGYQGYMFPAIDQSIEDPKKGVQGTCYFVFIPAILQPRKDSIHTNVADTTYFKVYVQDRAGHHSDTIVTKPIIMHP